MSKIPERFASQDFGNEIWGQVLVQAKREAWHTVDQLVWLPVWRGVGAQCWRAVRDQIKEVLR